MMAQLGSSAQLSLSGLCSAPGALDNDFCPYEMG